MDQLQKIFTYQEKQVRTMAINGEPWFVARDVCEALEMADVSMTVSRLDDDEKGASLICTPGGNQEMLIVNEPGLYSLILGSRKPEAKAFKRWITHEVIPAIRKTGSYIAPSSPTEALLQAVQILAQQEKQIKALVAATEVLNHRIDNMDAINTIGDLQQRLNAMIRKLAQQQGLSFSGAWKTFRGAYNLAFRTNLTMLVENYKMKHGLGKITVPQYLSKVGKLEDAIRVADKLLNRARGEAENAQSL